MGSEMIEADAGKPAEANKTVESKTALDELDAMRHSLQDAGLTLLKAATEVISAAANEAHSATKAVIQTADDTLNAAEEKIRKLRSKILNKE